MDTNIRRYCDSNIFKGDSPLDWFVSTVKFNPKAKHEGEEGGVESEVINRYTLETETSESLAREGIKRNGYEDGDGDDDGGYSSQAVESESEESDGDDGDEKEVEIGRRGGSYNNIDKNDSSEPKGRGKRRYRYEEERYDDENNGHTHLSTQNRKRKVESRKELHFGQKKVESLNELRGGFDWDEVKGTYGRGRGQSDKSSNSNKGFDNEQDTSYSYVYDPECEGIYDAEDDPRTCTIASKKKIETQLRGIQHVHHESKSSTPLPHLKQEQYIYKSHCSNNQVEAPEVPHADDDLETNHNLESWEWAMAEIYGFDDTEASSSDENGHQLSTQSQNNMGMPSNEQVCDLPMIDSFTAEHNNALTAIKSADKSIPTNEDSTPKATRISSTEGDFHKRMQDHYLHFLPIPLRSSSLPLDSRNISQRTFSAQLWREGTLVDLSEKQNQPLEGILVDFSEEIEDGEPVSLQGNRGEGGDVEDLIDFGENGQYFGDLSGGN